MAITMDINEVLMIYKWAIVHSICFLEGKGVHSVWCIWFLQGYCRLYRYARYLYSRIRTNSFKCHSKSLRVCQLPLNDFEMANEWTQNLYPHKLRSWFVLPGVATYTEPWTFDDQLVFPETYLEGLWAYPHSLIHLRESWTNFTISRCSFFCFSIHPSIHGSSTWFYTQE